MTLTSQIDASLAPFGVSFAVILVLGAVLFGVIEPDQGVDRLSAQLAKSWVTAAAKSKWRTVTHLTFMAGVSVLVYLAGLGSEHSHIHCSDLDQAGLKFSWMSWLGRDIEASCRGGELSTVWRPFSREESVQFRAAKDGVVVGECRVFDHNLGCAWKPRVNTIDRLTVRMDPTRRVRDGMLRERPSQVPRGRTPA